MKVYVVTETAGYPVSVVGIFSSATTMLSEIMSRIPKTMNISVRFDGKNGEVTAAERKGDPIADRRYRIETRVVLE